MIGDGINDALGLTAAVIFESKDYYLHISCIPLILVV